MSRFNESNNPMFNKDRVRAQARTLGMDTEGYMTKIGAVNKTIMLFGIMLLTGLYAFTNPSMMMIYGGMFGGLILFFVTMWKPNLAPITAPIYAAFEGFFAGGLSVIYGAAQGGLVFQAISITVCILLTMLIIYRSGIIPVTNKLRTGIIAATGGIFIIYMLNFVLSFFGISLPYLHSGGMIGIGITLVIIGIAAMNLLLDFDFIEKSEDQQLPKYMEWYAGMGILATLVWIYIEVLRLLSILNRD